MAQTSKTVIMPVPIGKVWDTICNYEAYPGHINAVKSAEVKSRDKKLVCVEYRVELLGKDIFYVLEHVEEKPIFDLLLGTLSELCAAEDCRTLLRRFAAAWAA